MNSETAQYFEQLARFLLVLAAVVQQEAVCVECERHAVCCGPVRATATGRTRALRTLLVLGAVVFGAAR